MFPNLIIPGVELQNELNEVPVDSDSSSDDWENSLGSSELYYSHSESSSDEEEFLVEIPKLSKYLVTF